METWRCYRVEEPTPAPKRIYPKTVKIKKLKAVRVVEVVDVDDYDDVIFIKC